MTACCYRYRWEDESWYGKSSLSNASIVLSDVQTMQSGLWCFKNRILQLWKVNHCCSHSLPAPLCLSDWKINYVIKIIHLTHLTYYAICWAYSDWQHFMKTIENSPVLRRQDKDNKTDEQRDKACIKPEDRKERSKISTDVRETEHTFGLCRSWLVSF